MNFSFANDFFNKLFSYWNRDSNYTKGSLLKLDKEKNAKWAGEKRKRGLKLHHKIQSRRKIFFVVTLKKLVLFWAAHLDFSSKIAIYKLELPLEIPMASNSLVHITKLYEKKFLLFPPFWTWKLPNFSHADNPVIK